MYTLKISDYTENSNFLPQSRENTPSRPDETGKGEAPPDTERWSLWRLFGE